MKLNQATAAAAVLSATLASSSAASSSARDELKDKIAPLLASMPNRYLLRNRMLQSSGDECVQAMIDDEVNGALSTYDNATNACASETVVGNTTIRDLDDCDVALLTEACAADSRTLVADRGGDVGVDCTVQGEYFFKAIFKENFECLRTSCVSWWESGEGGPFSDEYREGLEGLLSDLTGADDVECKIYSASADSSAVGAGETSSVGTNAGEDTVVAKASSVGSRESKANGMLALAATAAAAALVFF